jgi:hypothetical protein
MASEVRILAVPERVRCPKRFWTTNRASVGHLDRISSYSRSALEECERRRHPADILRAPTRIRGYDLEEREEEETGDHGDREYAKESPSSSHVPD